MPSTGWRIERQMPASHSAIDDVCADVRNRLKGSVPDADSFAVELLLREVLVNAVKHGCKDRPGATIRCDVRQEGDALWIRVADGGPGFDWRCRQRAELPHLATSGRGIALYALYAHHVAFNPAGNEVVLCRRFGESSEEMRHEPTSHQP